LVGDDKNREIKPSNKEIEEIIKKRGVNRIKNGEIDSWDPQTIKVSSFSREDYLIFYSVVSRAFKTLQEQMKKLREMQEKEAKEKQKGINKERKPGYIQSSGKNHKISKISNESNTQYNKTTSKTDSLSQSKLEEIAYQNERNLKKKKKEEKEFSKDINKIKETTEEYHEFIVEEAVDHGNKIKYNKKDQ